MMILASNEDTSLECTQCGHRFNLNKRNYCPKCGYEGDVFKFEEEIKEDLRYLESKEFDQDEI